MQSKRTRRFSETRTFPRQKPRYQPCVAVIRLLSKLPFRLEICNCNEHELKDYVSKLIRVDIVEHEGKPVSRIAWGKSRGRPSFWPDNIALWDQCRSPNNSQEYDFGMPFVEVLKEAVKRALAAKGLDWREHYDKDCDKGVELRRMKSRGINLSDNVIGDNTPRDFKFEP